jgi:urease accessory protein
LLGAAPAAHAHSTVEGLDEFTNGLVHPLFVPAQVLLLVALGLLVSKQRPFDPRRPLLAFAIAAMAGLAMGLKPLPPVFLLSVAIAMAVVLAADWKLYAKLRIPFAIAGGLLLGMDSHPENAADRMALLKAALGVWIGLNVWFMTAAYYPSLLPERKWATYAVRILASWIIAIAAMVLALSFRRAGA